MKIVQANASYDPAAKTTDELLNRTRPLTEWSAAIAGAGVAVSVVQRSRTAARLERYGVDYVLVADTHPPWLSTKGVPEEFIKAVAARSPDVVHVNGLIFPQLVAAIRKAVGANVAIVVQHHAGEFPIRGSGVVGIWQRQRWRNGLAAADAISFTAAGQAEPWRAAGILADQRIITITETSTTMRAVHRDRARTAVAATGAPLILWVGRATSSTDPATILDGLERALPQMPLARVMMLFGDDTLLHGVEQRVRDSAILSERVLLNARISDEEMPNYYGAADLFVSGSQTDGGGLALIEAMSAGVVPVVTDIPAFRAIAGECGARFPAGDAEAFAAQLITTAGGLAEAKAATKSRFDRELSWTAIAARTLTEYQSVLQARRAG